MIVSGRATAYSKRLAKTPPSGERLFGIVEARAGIEPAYKDLQSSA